MTHGAGKPPLRRGFFFTYGPTSGARFGQSEAVLIGARLGRDWRECRTVQDGMIVVINFVPAVAHMRVHIKYFRGKRNPKLYLLRAHLGEGGRPILEWKLEFFSAAVMVRCERLAWPSLSF